MLETYLFIAIIYTGGFIINKSLDIIYDHDTYVDHFSSFFLIAIWLLVATSSWNIIYAVLFSIILSGLFSYLFGIYQNKSKHSLRWHKSTESKSDTDVTADNLELKSDVETNDFSNALKEWIGLTGTIISYDNEYDYYYGTLDDKRSIILKSEGEKLEKGDSFITTKIEGVNIFCKKA